MSLILTILEVIFSFLVKNFNYRNEILLLPHNAKAFFLISFLAVIPYLKLHALV